GNGAIACPSTGSAREYFSGDRFTSCGTARSTSDPYTWLRSAARAWLPVGSRIARQVGLLGAICAHDIDLVVSITVGRKRNPIPIRRIARIRVVASAGRLPDVVAMHTNGEYIVIASLPSLPTIR
ncbi:MAG: hypothetical protein PHQ40_12030, partial [Anaerolineaceae bacterium]|nr:hypothetical protein [Anaerolineaceae bacterium]